MSIVKLNNRGVRSATTFGSISSLGSMTFLSKQTASSSSTISFTSGIDSTYKEYLFTFNNIHPATDGAEFQFQANGTAFQLLAYNIDNGNDANLSGYLHLFNPSSSTFVKNFL